MNEFVARTSTSNVPPHLTYQFDHQRVYAFCQIMCILHIDVSAKVLAELIFSKVGNLKNDFLIVRPIISIIYQSYSLKRILEYKPTPQSYDFAGMTPLTMLLLQGCTLWCALGSVNMRKKVAFSCLLQAGERNFSSSYSQNPERTLKCAPVESDCFCEMTVIFKFSESRHNTSTLLALEVGSLLP